MRLMKVCVVMAMLAATALVGCDKKDAAQAPTAEATAEAPEVTVEQLSKMLDEKAPVTVVDANGAKTRADKGIIPGAVLMKDGEDTGCLPEEKDKGLVFYCGSEHCSSAPKAAAAAMKAGYKDVKVLKAGIKGWVEAGKKTDPAPKG